jgi:DEAD_2
MKVAILGSRDQLCVNPAVMQATSSREKLNMCQERFNIIYAHFSWIPQCCRPNYRPYFGHLQLISFFVFFAFLLLSLDKKLNNFKLKKCNPPPPPPGK